MKHNYIEPTIEIVELKLDTVLFTSGAENYIDGEGNGIGGIGDI